MSNILARRATKISILVLMAVSALFISCMEPSPLYGTWVDNDENSLSLFADGTFIAKIMENNRKVDFEGNYSLLRNVLTLDGTDARFSTEWDIRGNILYLDWKLVDGSYKSLTLYKVSEG